MVVVAFITTLFMLFVAAPIYAITKLHFMLRSEIEPAKPEVKPQETLVTVLFTQDC